MFWRKIAENTPHLRIFSPLECSLDRNAKSIVVLFNVDKIAKTISLPDYAGTPLELHPILRNSIADLVVKQSQYNAPTGTFTIPPRTTAVFLER